MKSTFFCLAHESRLRISESTALTTWNEHWERAGSAYTACRIQAAYTYFGCALEIALIRFECAENYYFTAQHIVKPFEFLVTLHLSEENFSEARMIITKAKLCMEKNNAAFTLPSREIIRQLELQVTITENEVFYQKSASSMGALSLQEASN